MNRKFSTLMACLLAGTTLSTVSAHMPEYRTIRTFAGVTTNTSTIKHIYADKWYQLRTTMVDPATKEKVSALLVQERDPQTGKLYLKAVPEKNCYSVYLLPSLWRIKYTEKDGVGGGKFTFVNKETNVELSYDHTYSATSNSGISKDNAVLEACNTTWEWYNNNSQSLDFEKVAPYSYTDNEKVQGQVMIMKMDADGLIYSYVDNSSKLLDNHGVLASANAVEIQPVVATSIVLNPQDFNSMIDFNKASQAQNAGFKFYKPNGDLLNPVEMDNMVSGGVMDPAMKYHAEYAYDEIFKIHSAAYDQLGGEDKLNLEKYAQAVQDAENAYKEAEIAYNPVYSAYREAQLQLAEKELAYNEAKANYDQELSESQSELQKLSQDAVKAQWFLEKFSNYQLLYSLNPKVDGAEVNKRKSILDKAVKEFNGGIGDDKVYIANKAREVLAATHNFLNCYQVSAGSSVAEQEQNAKEWADLISKNVANVGDYNDLLADLNTVSYSYTESGKEFESAKISFETADKQLADAEKIVREKGEAWKKAKEELASVENVLTKKVNYILNDGYMRLKYVENNGTAVTNNQYLMVDTAFWQNNQVPSKADLKISHKTPKTTDEEAIAARYFFKLTYFPTQDSLVVEPLNASAISDKDYNTGTPWRLSYAGNNFVYTEDVTERASAPSNTQTAIDDATNLPIVLKLDELNTSDLCLTAARANVAKDSYLKTRISFNNPYDYLKRFTPAEGLYFIKSKNTGKYVVANFAGNLQYDVEEAGAQDYNTMPATMFVVERPGCKNGTRSLVNNREYGNWTVYGNFEGQLYEDENGIYIINKNYPTGHVTNYNLATDDHYEFIPVEDKDALTSDKHGYQYLDPETLPYTEYAIHYNLAANQNLYLNVEDGFVKGTEGANTYYELSTVNPIDGKETVVNAFGYKSLNLPQLERQAYVLKVRDANLVDNDTTYVALVTEKGQNEYYKAMGIKDIRSGKGQLAQFYLKADQVNDGTKYYALVDVRATTYWAEVNNGARIAKYTDANGYMSHMNMDNQPSERVSAFALTVNDRPLYREVTDETINLFNNQNEKAVEDGMFLGFAKDNSKNGAMAVERLATDNARMPQYLLGFDKDSIADGFWCMSNTHGYFATEDDAKAADENHYVKYNGYTTGRYLVNFVDSVLPGSHAYNKPDKYTYKGVAVRLGFVEGVHMVVTADEAKYINEFLGIKVAAGEYFFTLVGGHTLADLKNEQGYIIPEKLFSAEYTKMNTYTTGKHNNWSFSFRLVDDNQDNFLVESNLPGVSSIGSMEGAWIKDYENVPVVSYIDGNHSSIEASDLKKDNVTDGTIFTLEATDEEATANENIAAGNVVVAGTNGAVVVKGAEGKNVIVSTILGKVVANEVVSSDNATIAAPAGIVVVSVDGESFKVVVK